LPAFISPIETFIITLAQRLGPAKIESSIKLSYIKDALR
jgi:hypothetical protein